MNNKVYSFIYCALLASTFVHEIRAKAEPSVIDSHHVSKRAVAPASSTVPLLNVTVELNLVIVTNTTNNCYTILSPHDRIFILVNGTSGSGAIINLKDNTITSLVSDLLKTVGGDVSSLLRSLGGTLASLLNTVGAVVSSLGPLLSGLLSGLGAALSGVVRLVASILNSLLNINIDLTLDPQTGLKLAVAICGRLLDILGGPPNLTVLLGNGSVVVYDDLVGLANILDGLRKVSVGATVGTNQSDPSLLTVLADSPNGLELLLDLLDGAVKVDLNVNNTVSVIASVGGFLNITAELGGCENEGINGIFRVLSTIVNFLEGRASLGQVINVLLQFVASLTASSSTDPSTNLTAVLDTTLRDLENTLKRLDLGQAVSGLLSTVTDLINGTCYLRGVNLSAIINLLLGAVGGTVTSLLEIVVAVLLLLAPVVDTVLALVTFLLVLILDLLSPLGVQLLISLGFILDGALNAVGRLLSSVLKLVFNLLNPLLRGLYDVLVSLPVVGPIVLALSEAISNATRGRLNLKQILNSNNPVGNLIKALLQILGVSLGASSGDIATVQQLAANSTNIGIFLGLDLSLSLLEALKLNVNITLG